MRGCIKAGLIGFVSLVALTSCSQPSSHDNVRVAHAAKEPAVEGTQNHLRLLSQNQYFNTIGGIFGADIVPNVRFAPFRRTEGLLSTGAAYESVTDTQIELYQRAAALTADLVVSPERREFMITCTPANPKAADDACATKFLGYIGQRLFRRPLEAEKLTEVVDKARVGAEKLNDFYAGLSLALEGLLLSPNALYIDEVTEPDPQNPGKRRLDGYSLASRLSFFLWNQAPDDMLLKAAASGELHAPKGRAKVIEAMLASPKLETGVRAFFDDMLGFDDFDTLAKDPNVYPAFTGVAVADSREQTLRVVVDQLITRNGDYRDLYTSRETFISKALAPLYQQPAPAVWVRYEAPADSPRVGFLTQVSFLALHSHPGRSSPTLRGKALRELLMCQPVPRPPANVDFSAIENPDPSMKTARDRLDAHRKNPVCAGCHKITDPMGLALENFDGSGQYRETEKGAAIDASGTLDGKEFKDVIGLGQALHDNPAVPACLVKRVFTYARGGKLRKEEQPIVDYFNGRFAADGYRMRNLMREVALSTAFSQIDEPETETPVKTASAASPETNAK